MRTNKQTVNGQKSMRCRIGDYAFWSPRLSPMYWVERQKTVLMRLMPVHHCKRQTLYQVRTPADVSVLPKWMRPYAHNKYYLGPLSSPSFPVFDDNWTADRRWESMMIDDAYKGMRLERGAITVEIQEKAENVWRLLSAPEHIPQFSAVSSDLRLRELQFRCECIIQECFHNPLGMQATTDALTKDYKQRQVVERDVYLAPGYCMAWCKYVDAGSDKLGKMQPDGDYPMRKPLGNGMPYARLGMTWLELSNDALSPKYASTVNYHKHALSVFHICKTCSADQRYPSLEKYPRIHFSDPFECKHCIRVLSKDDIAYDRRFFAGATTEELAMHALSPCECPSCGAVDTPKVKLTCSNPDCKNPQPTALDDVITYAKKDSAGVWQFGVFYIDAMPSLLPRWEDVIASYPQNIGSLNVPANVKDGYYDQFDPCKAGYYVYLSAPDQVRFLGSDLFNPSSEAAEQRRFEE